jgi:hypothetical protein
LGDIGTADMKVWRTSRAIAGKTRPKGRPERSRFRTGGFAGLQRVKPKWRNCDGCVFH